MTRPVERRSIREVAELRAADDGKRIGGYALKYNKLSQNLGGFVERIDPGFVDKSLADKADVLARYQHDDDRLLGRVSSGTLRLNSDEVGVDYEVDIPDTSYARDLSALVARGDVRHSSFAFRVMPEGESWEMTDEGFPMRILKRGGGQLVDVAPVVTPAYMDTSTGLRSLAEQRSLDFDTVKTAAEHNELGVLLREKEPTVLDLATAQRETHAGPSIRRMRLQLMERSFPARTTS